jgi:hypothetical protein
MKNSTSILLLLLVALVMLTGCSLVSCNHTFPKAEWYWSADAKECRAEKASDKKVEVDKTKPENP